MKRIIFYALIVFPLVVINSFLLSKPNILGKMGLIIYKFHYLRTFPRALLTVAIVVGIAVLVAESIRAFTLREAISDKMGRVVLVFFIAICGAILIKTGMDFSTWAVGHTGRRFKYGAYLLPIVLMIIFTFPLISLPKGLNDQKK